MVHAQVNCNKPKESLQFLFSSNMKLDEIAENTTGIKTVTKWLHF